MNGMDAKFKAITSEPGVDGAILSDINGLPIRASPGLEIRSGAAASIMSLASHLNPESDEKPLICVETSTT
jgi:hypothetical protein